MTLGLSDYIAAALVVGIAATYLGPKAKALWQRWRQRDPPPDPYTLGIHDRLDHAIALDSWIDEHCNQKTVDAWQQIVWPAVTHPNSWHEPDAIPVVLVDREGNLE